MARKRYIINDLSTKKSGKYLKEPRLLKKVVLICHVLLPVPKN